MMPLWHLGREKTPIYVHLGFLKCKQKTVSVVTVAPCGQATKMHKKPASIFCNYSRAIPRTAALAYQNAG